MLIPLRCESCPFQVVGMVTLKIPKILESCCGGKSSLEMDATSLRQLIAGLENDYPKLYSSMCTESGRTRRHIHLFRGDGSLLNGDDLDAVFKPHEVIFVFQAVSGG